MNANATQRLVTWLAGHDTGTSSKTMALVALGAEEGDFDAPHDHDDFGRCKRLADAVPEIRERFDAIGKACPTFRGILEEWDSLCEQYEQADKADGFGYTRSYAHRRAFGERIDALRNKYGQETHVRISPVMSVRRTK